MLPKNNAYYIVNLIFVALIGIALGYSYFFYPNNQPINCAVKELTGKACTSCGFSRAFSAFMHLKYQEGVAYNPNAFASFVFFISQFVLRTTLLCIEGFTDKLISKRVIYTEVVFTILHFLVAFTPLLL